MGSYKQDINLKSNMNKLNNKITNYIHIYIYIYMTYLTKIYSSYSI